MSQVHFSSETKTAKSSESMASPTQRLPIRIRKGTRADIDDVVRVENAAFGPGIMSRLMYPNGLSDDSRAKAAASLAKIFDDADVREQGSVSSKPKENESFLVVAETVPEGDESRPEVIAFARWDIWREPRKEEEWNVVEPVSAYTSEGANDEFVEAFLGGIHAMRRRNMKGDPALCKHPHSPWHNVTDSSTKGLRMLCSMPSRGRMGAGSGLLRWGTEIADREGLRCWLEASPHGYPLYKRFGFEAVDVLDLDLARKWGAVRRPDEDWGANNAVEVAGVAPEGVNRTPGMWRVPIKR